LGRRGNSTTVEKKGGPSSLRGHGGRGEEGKAPLEGRMKKKKKEKRRTYRSHRAKKEGKALSASQTEALCKGKGRERTGTRKKEGSYLPAVGTR